MCILEEEKKTITTKKMRLLDVRDMLRKKKKKKKAKAPRNISIYMKHIHLQRTC